VFQVSAVPNSIEQTSNPQDNSTVLASLITASAFENSGLPGFSENATFKLGILPGEVTLMSSQQVYEAQTIWHI
jgi:hypothetical protein